MTKARDFADIAGAVSNGKIANSDVNVSFENIVDTGTEGTKVAQGTTAQRGSTEGQLRYNTTTDSLEIRNNTEFVALEKSLSVTSVSPTSITPSENTGGGNSITLTGVGFVSGATVKFIGNDGTEFNASSVSFTNSTTVVAVAPELTASKEPFDVKITNPSGNTAQIDNQIQINTSPVWQTAAGTLATINDNATGTHATLSATDADGETVSYTESTSVLSGAGLTLNSSTGAITGDPTNVNTNTTYTFDVNASDGTDTVNRTFNIVVNKVNDGSTSARAATSAQALYNLGITTSGVYYLTHSGATHPVWCDFSLNAGYMLAISINTANPSTADVWNTSSSDDSEIQVGDASPQARDVVSRLRRSGSFRYVMIKYEYSNVSPTNLYYNTPVVYDGSGNYGQALVSLPTDTLINRASGNSGVLPTSNCGGNASYNANKLRVNSSVIAHRPYKLTNYGTDNQNQAGFFGFAGNSGTQPYINTFDGGCNDGDTTKFELYIREN
tara:strand:+ start:574 stop:2070 length:1497 start_codon:yes stop_codon:yes gene_type:complete